jgi:GT2 family glycosyltransferase
MVKSDFPQTVLIENSENKGPAYAYNRGLEKSINSEYIILSNSDIEVMPKTIQRM